MKKNVWEINELFRCPVAGFCLSPSEQHAILRKFVPREKRISARRRMHDFMIANISTKSDIAKHVQKLLDKKYSKEIGSYQALDAAMWIKEADTLVNWENFGAFIWISAAYKKLNETATKLILGKIHNYSHQMYTELGDAKHGRINMCEQHKLMHTKYRDIRAKQKETQKEIRDLRSSNGLFASRNNALRDEIETLKKQHHDESRNLARYAYLERELEAKEQILLGLQSENKKLSKKLSAQMSFFLEMENDFEKLLNDLKGQKEKCSACDKIDLCRRRVLIVGGITKMETFYRKIVQELGGYFHYHDGYCRQDESVINNLVSQSDIVICPVDVNSHAACLQVKKACKKSGTDFFMLRKSSISTIYNTLKEVARA